MTSNLQFAPSPLHISRLVSDVSEPTKPASLLAMAQSKFGGRKLNLRAEGGCNMQIVARAASQDH